MTAAQHLLTHKVDGLCKRQGSCSLAALRKPSCSLAVITPMDAQQMGTPGGVTPDLHQRVADQPKKSGVESSSLPFCSDLGSLEREYHTWGSSVWNPLIRMGSTRKVGVYIEELWTDLRFLAWGLRHCPSQMLHVWNLAKCGLNLW